MIQWLKTRFGKSNTKLEEAPPTTIERTYPAGMSSRRGCTRRPLGMVRLQNRQRNRRARQSRRANRPT